MGQAHPDDDIRRLDGGSERALHSNMGAVVGQN